MSFKCVSVSNLFPVYLYLPTVKCLSGLWAGYWVVRMLRSENTHVRTDTTFAVLTL